MKIVFVLAYILACVLALRGPQPPLWPEIYSQDYVVGDKTSRYHETGKIWIDFASGKQRFDTSGSYYEEICHGLNPDKAGRCSMFSIKGALYISSPQKSKCCACCLPGDDCVPLRRDWLKNYTYAGEASLSGQTFYKWTYQTESFYATEDAQRIPRRIESTNLVWDFIMNTYSTDPIKDSIFQVPSNCNGFCPSGSGCRTSTEKPNVASLRQTLFGKF